MEVVRDAGAGVQGPAPGRLGARDFFEAAEAKREVPGAAERQSELDHGAGEAGGQCADFAGAGDCHSEKTLRESARLESRVAPGVMEYARSPKLPFEAQMCHKDALYVGVDVVRCRRNGLANAPPLSLEGVSQMVYILPERLPALVRPAFDLVLRRIRSLKRCVQA